MGNQRKTPSPASVLDAEDAGPKAMRLFSGIADQWRLSEEERWHLLLLSADEYQRRLREKLPLPQDLVFRIGYCVHIYGALRTIFGDGERMAGWLRRPHGEGQLCPNSALDLMLSGDLERLREVSNYLRQYTE